MKLRVYSSRKDRNSEHVTDVEVEGGLPRWLTVAIVSGGVVLLGGPPLYSYLT